MNMNKNLNDNRRIIWLTLAIAATITVGMWIGSSSALAKRISALPDVAPQPTSVAYTNYRISGSVLDANSKGVPDVEIMFQGIRNQQPVTLMTDFAGNFVYNYPDDDGFTITPAKNGYVFSPNKARVVVSGNSEHNFGMIFTAIPAAPAPDNTFTVPNTVDVSEGQGQAEVTVTRTGDVSAPASLPYVTSRGPASDKTDYMMVLGTLRFAANETAKTVVVPIIDDSYDEFFPETFHVEFHDGATMLLTSVRIIDNDTPPELSNPLDNAQFFVRQHYLDFLGRNPDQGGQDFWTNKLTACNGDPACLHNQTLDVSAAFFIGPEFQDTGSFVYRLYKAALGRTPTETEFILDRSAVIGGADLEASKQALVYAWVNRPEFRQAYALDFNADFVNKLFDTAGLIPFTTERQQALTAMNAGRTRAQVLRDVIELDAFKQREYNASFVAMQYFGYLRRAPDQAGYDFWLGVLDGLPAPENYRSMVCAFITSAEYQDRFGSLRTHNNGECAP
jgi:hypothetical protein